MHSYKIIIHFVDSTVVDVFLWDIEMSINKMLDQFAKNTWLRIDYNDMVINTTNITHIEVIDITGHEEKYKKWQS